MADASDQLTEWASSLWREGTLTSQARRQGDDSEEARGYDWLPLLLLLVGLVTHFSHFSAAPPGLHGDSARLGLHAIDFLQRGVWPFYVYHMAAPNPLIIYLQSLAFLVFGFTPAALRGVTTLGGALAAPALYVACRELLSGDGGQFARRTGVMAALGLALTPFFGVFSRHGIEPALLPAIELLVVASLWRGLRRGRWIDFCVGGILLGISQYAYIVARVFPLALAAACGIAALVDRRLLARWRGVLLAAAAAAIVALPQWLLFLRAPYTFVARTQGAGQPFILGLPDAGALLVTKLMNQVRMLGWRWSTGYHPVSTRPLLTPILFGGLLVALVVTFRVRRASWAFVLALMVLLLVPDLLFVEGLFPSANRVVAALPFIFVMGGLGCALVWRWLETRLRLPSWVPLLVPALMLLAGAESQWHFRAEVLPQVHATPGLEWRASLVELAEAEYIAAHLDEAILLPSSEYQRAPMAFLLAEHYTRRASGLPISLSSGETVIVVAPVEPDRTSTEGIPAGYVPDEWVLLKDGVAYFLPPVPGALEGEGDRQQLVASNGALAAEVFSARWTGVAPPIESLDASFANGLDLVGYRTSAFSGEGRLTLTLYWRPLHRIAEDTQIFVQLFDRHGQKLAGIHDWPLREAYRVRAWEPGETMPLSYRIEVPPGLAPGPYPLTVGVYDLVYQRRVPLLDGRDVATVATLKVSLLPSDVVPERSAGAAFGEGIGLTGYTLTPEVGAVNVALFWEAKAQIEADYTVFIHIVGNDGQIAAQADAQPLEGQYPTTLWDAGETVVDQREIPVAAGEYRVYVGIYHWQTLERLPAVVSGERQSDDRLLLGLVEVP